MQEFVFIPLDIFYKKLYNKGIATLLDAWLVFLGVSDPEWIEKLIRRYLEFIPLYEEVYAICTNMERVMGIFSEELKMLDKNIVQPTLWIWIVIIGIALVLFLVACLCLQAVFGVRCHRHRPGGSDHWGGCVWKSFPQFCPSSTGGFPGIHHLLSGTSGSYLAGS